MKEWLQNYGYLLFILAAVIVLFVVVFYFAVRAYSKHMNAYKKEEAELKRLTALKEKYKPFDENVIRSAPADEILEGVALVYQVYLQKKDDMEKEFLLMKKEQQYIYVLDVFVSDGSLRSFFRDNADILRCRLVPALELIGLCDVAEKAERIRKMYDVKEEEVSLDEKLIEETDKVFLDSDVLSRIKLHSAEYIKENVSILKQ